MDLAVLQQLVVSLGLGMLLGLQRERTEHSIGGIRTFPFIALFGTVCAQIGEITGTWIIAAGLIALAALVITANLAKIKQADLDPGMTTEMATLLVYALGVLIVVGDMTSAVVLGGGMALLLHYKGPLHDFARAVGERDMHAIIQFVLITMIILPVLPNENYGPYGVLNPFKIWLMVVLIVGISLCGYVAYKLFGARSGTLLGGIIGGLVSSTATTVSYARRTT
ncbi:MAG TPA: MgtC/SapB family protein, partial [Luteolibacter sp.]